MRKPKRTPHALAYTGVGSGMPGTCGPQFEYGMRCPALVRGESLIHSCRSIWLYIQTLSPNSTESRHHLSSSDTRLSLWTLERPACGVRGGWSRMVSRAWSRGRGIPHGIPLCARHHSGKRLYIRGTRVTLLLYIIERSAGIHMKSAITSR